MTTCTRCNEADAAGFCCEAHGKQLCHRCYRRTHFVEICMPGCPGCEREGLNPNATVGDRVPKPKPAPLSEKWANMPSAEPTSARLARVTDERDEAVANFKRLQELAREDFVTTTEVMAETNRQRDLAISVRDELKAELDRVSTASWVVARDANYECERCHQTIQRGEAYTADDAYWHVHCRDPEPEVVVAYDAWHCDEGHRYPYPNPGTHTCMSPLRPVRVTITHRQTPEE